MSDTHLIKKYANRRLYDTVNSRHITLEGIRQLVASGTDVQIVDDASGEDITRTILLQIIAEREQGERPMLDAGFLMQLIRLYGHPVQEMIGDYLVKSFDGFLKQQAEYQEQMRKALETSPMVAFREVAESQMQAWRQMQEAMLGKKPQSDPKNDPE